MADFNTLTEEQIKIELATYGYTWKETTNDSSPLIMFFDDVNGGVLKLTVDTISQAQIYGYTPATPWRDQPEALATSTVTDTASLDALLIPVYTNIDPTSIKIEYLTEISNRVVLVPDVVTYYTSTQFLEPTVAATPHVVSEFPSPYRERDLIWVPITFNSPNWELTYNSSVIVNTADKVTNAYGDFIVVLPE